MFKSIPFNVKENKEEFTSTSDKTVATNEEHNVDSTENTSVDCPEGIAVCDSDTGVNAYANQSSENNTEIKYSIEKISELKEKCENETGFYVRTLNENSDPILTFYKDTAINSGIKGQLCDIYPTYTIDDEGDIFNSNGAKIGNIENDEFELETYCKLDCGSKDTQKSSYKEGTLNENRNDIEFTTSANKNKSNKNQSNKNKSNKNQSNKNKSNGLSGGAIAGIVIGTLIFIIIVIFAVKFYLKNPKKNPKKNKN